MSGYFRFASLDQLIIGVIRGYYIKYNRLAMLINAQFKNSSATSVDMYIDLMDIFCKVDKAITDDSLALENPLAITSAIINLTAHYRNFFYSWYKCTTRFWIINAKSNSLSTKYFPGFEERTLSPMMNRLYELNVETLKMLCNYINDIQYEEYS